MSATSWVDAFLVGIGLLVASACVVVGVVSMATAPPANEPRWLEWLAVAFGAVALLGAAAMIARHFVAHRDGAGQWWTVTALTLLGLLVALNVVVYGDTIGSEDGIQFIVSEVGGNVMILGLTLGLSSIGLLWDRQIPALPDEASPVAH